jgi:hypothetical protein
VAAICRQCGQRLGVSLPPVRTRKAPCDLCGNQNEAPRGMNYDYPDRLLPGNSREPNTVAEREENAVR